MSMGYLTKTLSFKLILIAFFAVLIVLGVFIEDIPEVVANATLICYSCIGLK